MILFLRFHLIVLIFAGIVYCSPLNEYISHYRPLDYDVNEIHSAHERSKRSVSSSNEPVYVELHSNMKLRLRRESPAFHRDVRVVIDGVEESPDLSHLYKGHVVGEPRSDVTGALIMGRFEGTVRFPNGTTFHIEFARHFFDGAPSFHSVMYLEDHVDMAAFEGHRSRQRRDTDSSSEGKPCGLSHPDIADEIKREQEEMIVEDVKTDSVKTDSATTDSAKTDGARARRNSASPFMERVVREKRQTTGRAMRTVCSLFMQSDPELWRYYMGILGTTENRNVVIRDSITSLFNAHVESINGIYTTTTFTSISGVNYRNYGFRILRVQINSTDGTAGPYTDRAIGVTTFLNLNSFTNHDSYCLAYVFTYRDFEGGTLGLAWVASPGSLNGGVCSKFRPFQENGRTVTKSLNTGIVSLLNYGKKVASSVSYVTFAHEAGHNFGSNHDDPNNPACVGSERLGNYIMYASATSGNLINNRLFSSCSNRAMSAVIHALKTGSEQNDCFIEPDSAWCGNSVKEPGEECDCGYESDNGCGCCVGQSNTNNNANACTVPNNVPCDPSQGPCCTPLCQLVSSSMCQPQSECAGAAFCTGSNAQCPIPTPVEDLTPCNGNTQVCRNGSCEGSICDKISPAGAWESCYPTTSEGKCHVACREKMNNNTCWSSYFYGRDGSFPTAFASALEGLSNASVSDKSIHVQPGHPCDNLQGFCDTLFRCRAVDADGPLARLKNLFFSDEAVEQLRAWVTQYWWAVVLMGLGLIVLMGLFIKFCAVHTPSSNPNKKAARSLSTTLTIRRRRPPPSGGQQGRPRGQPQPQARHQQQQQADRPPSYPGSAPVPKNYKRQDGKGARNMEMKHMRV